MTEPALTRLGLGERIAEVLAIDPSAGAVEHDGTWTTWGELASIADRVAASVPAPGTEVEVVLRNDPEAVGAVLGVLIAGGCVVVVNPMKSLRSSSPDDPGVRVLDTVRPGVAVRMPTSGTTGPPKQVDLAHETFEKVLVGAKHYESGPGDARRLRTGVAIVNAPLAHVGGLFRVLQCATDGRPFVLLEKFTVDGWLDAVRRHRPKTTSLVPAALRMVLDADLDPDDLSSLKSVVSGTAPLDPADADAFFETYGVPVLISYGATEFAGGVAGWNIRDHAEFWATKKGSVGRAHRGCSLRVVDPETGAELGPDEEGILHVQAAQLPGEGWIETTDLARIDADGFLFILGRADQAIIRGGFKVIPDTVRSALERHPAVRGAAVVGRDDRRLGAVPVAAVDLRPDAEPVTADDLRAFLAEDLSPYEVPTEIRVVDELPRTDSGKADLRAVSSLLGGDD